MTISDWNVKIYGAYFFFRPLQRAFGVHRGSRAGACLLRYVLENSPESGKCNFAYAIERVSSETGIPEAHLTSALNEFYLNHMNRLRPLMKPNALAIAAVRMARARGFRVALWTNPIWPRIGVRQRLSWADLKIEDFDVITDAENSHFVKPSEEYYREALKALNTDASDCLFFGDSETKDLPAARLGIETHLMKSNDDWRPWLRLFSSSS